MADCVQKVFKKRAFENLFDYLLTEELKALRATQALKRLSLPVEMGRFKKKFYK